MLCQPVYVSRDDTATAHFISVTKHAVPPEKLGFAWVSKDSFQTAAHRDLHLSQKWDQACRGANVTLYCILHRDIWEATGSNKERVRPSRFVLVMPEAVQKQTYISQK